jgi:hypothetical protein
MSRYQTLLSISRAGLLASARVVAADPAQLTSDEARPLRERHRRRGWFVVPHVPRGKASPWVEEPRAQSTVMP